MGENGEEKNRPGEDGKEDDRKEAIAKETKQSEVIAEGGDSVIEDVSTKGAAGVSKKSDTVRDGIRGGLDDGVKTVLKDVEEGAKRIVDSNVNDEVLKDGGKKEIGLPQNETKEEKNKDKKKIDPDRKGRSKKISGLSIKKEIDQSINNIVEPNKKDQTNEEKLLLVKPDQGDGKSKGRRTPRVSPSRERKAQHSVDIPKEDGEPEPGHDLPDIIVTFGKGDNQGYFIAHAVEDSKGFAKGISKGDGKETKKADDKVQEKSASDKKDRSPVRDKTLKKKKKRSVESIKEADKLGRFNSFK